MVGEVELCLLLAGGIAVVIAVVRHEGDEAFLAGLDAHLAEVDDDGEVAALVLTGLSSVDKYFLLPHDGLEVQGNLLALHVGGHGEVLAIPAGALVVAASTGLRGL